MAATLASLERGDSPDQLREEILLVLRRMEAALPALEGNDLP